MSKRRLCWFWRRHEVPAVDIEESRRALREAGEWQVRTRRVAKATERAIVQNHFAHDMEEVWPHGRTR